MAKTCPPNAYEEMEVVRASGKGQGDRVMLGTPLLGWGFGAPWALGAGVALSSAFPKWLKFCSQSRLRHSISTANNASW